jgi:hypothetical protein
MSWMIPSPWQARRALKRQDELQRHSDVNRFNFARRRSVELLRANVCIG